MARPDGHRRRESVLMTAHAEVAIAEQIARRVHAHQTKKLTGEPVIQHVARVVALVEAAHHEQVTAVAWLHDVIERSDLTTEALLEQGISPEVVEAVGLLTRAEHESYAMYITRVRASSNALAITVKVADLQDHLRPNCPPERRPRYERALTELNHGTALHSKTAPPRHRP